MRLENFPESPRWYLGAGLHGNVHLMVTEAAHIPIWGTQLTTPVIAKEFTKVNLKTKVKHGEGQQVTDFTCQRKLRMLQEM